MPAPDIRFPDIPFQQAHNIGKLITPQLVILHDTASRLTKGNAANYLRSANRPKVSVHYVIERDGSTEQQVPTNRRANHAGRSSYHGRQHCNNFSIGIELVNPGKMTTARGGKARAYWGELFDIDEYEIETRTTAEHGPGTWMRHTVEQLEATEELVARLFDAIPTLEDIRGHWYVSPGRKVDPNPLFPLAELRQSILGPDDPTEARALRRSSPAASGDMAIIDSPSDVLNMRAWPSFNPNVIRQIPHGVAVPVIRRGEFDGEPWARVRYGGLEGWVVEKYLAPVTHSEMA